MITSTSNGVLIDVRVIPRASRTGPMGMRGGALLIRVHAPPIEGAANTELVDILSELLGVSRRAVTIVAGERSRVKRVRVEGVSAKIVNARLLLQNPPSS